ncbi:hypothetical protein [uncultured Jannaschia sp.]|nr:hypothetical protein [uncultured Jannaschia sp.]
MGASPCSETRFYVSTVLAAWNVARLSCCPPPEMPGGGCDFDLSRADS